MNSSSPTHYLKILLVFCFLVLGVCYMQGVSKGLNTRITLGFQDDGTSISIALSRLQFHFWHGYLGYRQIYDTLSHVLVPDNNQENPNEWAFLSNSHMIQQAFNNAKHVASNTLPAYSMFSPSFVSINTNGIGLADFYTLAFFLFGAHSTAMYNTYFFLMALSLILFFVEYRSQVFPLLLISLIVGTFPIFFFSSFFSTPIIPSVDSFRFIATLAFIPMTHVLCLYFQQENKWTYMQVFRLICQSLFFAFVLSIRASIEWQVIALVLLALTIFIRLCWPYRNRLFELERLRLLKTPILMSTLVFLLAVFSYQKIQSMLLDPIYDTACVGDHHLVWHVAYLGFQQSPGWIKIDPMLKTHPALRSIMGDGDAWQAFVDYMPTHGGINPICGITGELMYGFDGLLTQDMFFSIIRKHKVFALKLYGYYKPRAIMSMLYVSILKRQA